MAIGEVFLGAVLQVLFQRMESCQLWEFVSQFRGICSGLKEWKKKLQMIEAVLIDAEEKQVSNRAVKIWLDDLQDLAYDVEDVLDEFATQALESKLKAENRSRFGNIVSSPLNTLKLNFAMRSKMKDVTHRLDELCQQKNKFNLDTGTGGGAFSSTSYVSQMTTPTTCAQRHFAVIGRDDEGKRIIDMVLRDDSGCSPSNFQVISVVGMGGIGKTTLAQTVYNDCKVLGKFDVKAWVCASQDFDTHSISKGILESITLSSCDLKDLNQVQLKLRKHVADKKFLVVLDDVWSCNSLKWEELRSLFKDGAPGSKIIVTTRIKEVALMMGPIQYYELTPLSDAACWSIFKEHVLQNRDVDVYGNLEQVCNKVTAWCKGLPLAAQTLGGLLRHKERREWEGILDCKIWDLPYNNCDCDILPVLKLSYLHLPSHLKRCFAYCAIFPHDHRFDEKELVLLWMAEGFVHESKYKQMEDQGHDYFRDLLSRSFFQRSTICSSKYIMHDRVNDLAQWVSGDTCLRLEVGSEIQWEKIRRVRHSSIISNHHGRRNSFEIFFKAKRLRTCLPCFDMVDLPFLPKWKRLRVLSLKGYRGSELPDSVGDLRHLRSLILAYSWIKTLPESTCTLCNLQTLDLKDCHYLEMLPSKIGDLINLRYLDIRGAILIREIPVRLKELSNLRTLWSFDVGKAERGLGLKYLKNMKSLCELSISGMNLVSVEDEAVLGEMKNLKVLILAWKPPSNGHAQDEEVLKLLQPHTNLEELQLKGYGGSSFPSWIQMLHKVNRISISDCQNLKFLWQYDLSLRRSLEGLHSLTSLSELSIQNCPNIVSISEICFLPKLTKLLIDRCSALTSLPQGIGYRNAHLEILGIYSCHSLRFVFGGQITPSLKHLSISCCAKLKRLLDDREDADTSSKEHANSGRKSLLEYLYIEHCPSLKCLSSSGQLPGALKHLEINACYKLTMLTSGGQLPKALEQLKVSNCPKIESIAERMHVNTCLETLYIACCENLKFIPDGLHELSRLHDFDIKHCPSLVSLAEGGLPKTVSYVNIECCPRLKALPSGIYSLNCIQRLSIKGCPSITYNPRDGFPTNITELDIEADLTDFKPLIEWGFHRLTSLRSLYIYGWRDVVSFPVEEMSMTLPSSLTELEICNFPKLEYLSSQGFENLTSLRSLWIQNCPNLTSFPKEGLPPSLLKLDMNRCPLLEHRCRKDQGPEWHKIANIPHVLVF